MYTTAVQDALNEILKSSSDAQAYNSIRLIATLTAALDRDMINEASHLAAVEVQRCWEALTAKKTALETYDEPMETKPVSTSFKKVQVSPAKYIEVVSNTIQAYATRPQLEVQPEAEYQRIYSLYSRLLDAVNVLLNDRAGFYLNLFTGTFRQQVLDWIEAVRNSPSNTTVVEKLGVVKYFLELSSNNIENISQKYSGSMAVIGGIAARIEVDPGPYCAPTATNVSWRDTPGGGIATWTIPQSTQAILRGAHGYPIPDGTWNIAPGVDVINIRINNFNYPNSTIPTALYASTANLAVAINIQFVANGVPVVASADGNELLFTLDTPYSTEGIQLHAPSSTFNDVAEFTPNWAQGTSSSLPTGGPTIESEPVLVLDESLAILPMVATGTIQVFGAHPEILPGDIVYVNYTSIDGPLDAFYQVETSVVAANTSLSVSCGSAQFVAVGEVPVETIGVDCPCRVTVWREPVYLMSDDYLWIAASTILGLGVDTEAYSTGDTLTLGEYPGAPVRVGDVVTISSTAYLATSTDPIRISGAVSSDLTTCVISSGMYDTYEALSISSFLKKVAADKQAAMDRIRRHMARFPQTSGFLADLDAALESFYTDILVILSSVYYQPTRIPRIAALLKSKEYTRAADLLLRGNLVWFFNSTAGEGTYMGNVLGTIKNV